MAANTDGKVLTSSHYLHPRGNFAPQSGWPGILWASKLWFHLPHPWGKCVFPTPLQPLSSNITPHYCCTL